MHDLVKQLVLLLVVVVHLQVAVVRSVHLHSREIMLMGGLG